MANNKGAAYFYYLCMVKKAVVICLMLLYGSATIGATVHIHYCMNRVTGSSIWNDNSNACTNCGMPKNKSHGCCHDECKQLKLCADQQLSSTSCTLSNGLQQATVPYYCNNAGFRLPPVVIVTTISYTPPGKNRQSLYIQNCTLRI
ncbi:MAG TPA: hypothetical protein VG738_08560 [Chitinophagaceae bacterium]|nr:hypothetical protein [Chitinophagaceae bacterium]